jgi:hypothetical protein
VGLFLRFESAKEAVASPRYRLDEMRTVGGVAQDFAEPVNRLLERQVVINERISWPDALAQFLARDDLLRTLQQGLQDLKGLAREFLFHAGLANLTGLQVHFEDPELYYLWLAGHGVHRPTLLATDRSLSRLGSEADKCPHGTMRS